MRFASCMAPNAENFFIDTVQYLGDQLGIETVVAHDSDWETRERLLDHGQIEVGWICGLPYVWKVDTPSPGVQLLAAPVMFGKRYGNQAVYFSDVMVREDHPARTLADLKGARWAYNEPGSHSGYNVLKSHLFDLGEKDGFCGSVHEAGSHENALQWILEGFVDAAAIDTTVFETFVRQDPSLTNKLRSIVSLGPSPMPPWVVSTEVAPSNREKLKQELIEMHHHSRGKQILHRHAVARFEAVEDAFYDHIRSMDQKARQVSLERRPNNL